MSKEAMKLALEALEESQTNNDTMEFHDRKNKAIDALREALAEQPAQPSKPLTDEQAVKIVQHVVSTSDRPIGAVALGLLVLRASETAHNIKENT